MKSSITGRLFRYILFVVLGFTALILLTNTLLLRPLYYRSLKNSMLGAMDQLSKIDYSQEEDVWLRELSKTGLGKGYDVVVKSEDGVIYSTSNEVGLYPRRNASQGGGQQPKNGQQFMLKRLLARKEIKETADGTFIGEVRIPGEGINLMICFKEMPDASTVVLTQPIEPINQSVMQSNILLIACALLAVLISLIIVFRLSRRFTRPIRQIKGTVGEMAALNFDHRCDVNTGDELESLAGDVNRLGDELQNALETLRAQNTQLEKDIEAQKQFISNASHELRTPLSLIKGYADEMNIRSVGTPEQDAAYIEIIAEEAAKMNRLLSEMLELSRMESGNIEMRYETLAVGEQIGLFLEKYDGYIKDKGLDVTFNLAESGIGRFDPMRFEQILANYISNAARYGDSERRIEISTEVFDDHIRIAVFNSGDAIDEALLPELWDRFYKADGARSREKNSYGLGLAVVKAIQMVSGQGFGTKNVPDGVVFWFEVQRVKKAETDA